MLVGKHKLMRDGARGQAVVLREERRGAGTRDWRQYLDVRFQCPDGSVVEFSGHVLLNEIKGDFFHVDDIVPVRYDPTDYRRMVFDVPRLRAEKAARDAGPQQIEQGLTADAVAVVLEQMADLGELRNRGALTDIEYEAEKVKLQDLTKRRNSGAITEAEFEAENAARLAGLPPSPST